MKTINKGTWLPGSLAPWLPGDNELLKGKDLASSIIMSPAPSTGHDPEFLDQGRCPLLESSHEDESELGQQLVVFDAGSMDTLSQASLHLFSLACNCLQVWHRHMPEGRGRRGK